MIHAEARGEPYIGQVAVGAVIINRLKADNFQIQCTKSYSRKMHSNQLGMEVFGNNQMKWPIVQL